MASDCVARLELVRGTHGQTVKHLFTIEEDVTFEGTAKEKGGRTMVPILSGWRGLRSFLEFRGGLDSLAGLSGGMWPKVEITGARKSLWIPGSFNKTSPIVRNRCLFIRRRLRKRNCIQIPPATAKFSACLWIICLRKEKKGTWDTVFELFHRKMFEWSLLFCIILIVCYSKLWNDTMLYKNTQNLYYEQRDYTQKLEFQWRIRLTGYIVLTNVVNIFYWERKFEMCQNF